MHLYIYTVSPTISKSASPALQFLISDDISPKATDTKRKVALAQRQDFKYSVIHQIKKKPTGTQDSQVPLSVPLSLHLQYFIFLLVSFLTQSFLASFVEHVCDTNTKQNTNGFFLVVFSLCVQQDRSWFSDKSLHLFLSRQTPKLLSHSTF